MKNFGLWIFCFMLMEGMILGPADASASVESELETMKAQLQTMQERFDALEKKVSEQQSQITQDTVAKEAYEKRISDLEAQLARRENPVTSQGPARSVNGRWTPEIGAVADIVYKQDSAKVDEEGADRVSLRELELVLGSNIDPYSRLDATISFSDTEDPALEEVYITNFALPWNITTRLGKFKPKVGKALAMHRDSLDTIDEPLVIAKYFGTEGMNKSGADFSKTLNLPWPVTHQAVLGILEGGNGEGGTAFGETRRRPTLYGHLKNYLDLTDTTGIELGLTQMLGSRDEDASFEVHVSGMDATLTHQLNANQNVKWQTEAFHLDRKESLVEVDDGLGGTTLADADDDFWGGLQPAGSSFSSTMVNGIPL